jgi:hypothetical protein
MASSGDRVCPKWIVERWDGHGDAWPSAGASERIPTPPRQPNSATRFAGAEYVPTTFR